MPALTPDLDLHPTPFAELPPSCDVVVVGAGPAGCACATWLAQQGRHVVLVERAALPRDKVCGDALIPDAMAALSTLGVHASVMAHARPVSAVACVGPRGGRVEVQGELAVIPRLVLDALLARHAQAQGALLVAPARFVKPLVDDAGRVVGAELAGEAGQTAHVQASWVVLATGATVTPLEAAGVCRRRAPTGLALRGYLRNDAAAAMPQALEVIWHQAARPGYAWIFPAPGGLFNVGVGLVNSHHDRADGHAAMRDVNLRRVFEQFALSYPPLQALVASGQWVGDLRGAPLRCSLDGADWSRPGLLVSGEAAGSTYSFTGEGIGKALQTGIEAAQALLLSAPTTGRMTQGARDAEIQADYHARLEALKPRFALYDKANRVNQHPWLADLLIWRARGSERLRHRMAGVLNETANPATLVSWRIIPKLLRG